MSDPGRLRHGLSDGVSCERGFYTFSHFQQFHLDYLFLSCFASVYRIFFIFFFSFRFLLIARSQQRDSRYRVVSDTFETDSVESRQREVNVIISISILLCF